jgi:hypothetical protein
MASVAASDARTQGAPVAALPARPRTWQRAVCAAASVVAVLGAGASLAATPAYAASPAWSLHVVAEPSSFSPADKGPCEDLVKEKCDRYQLQVLNIGDAPSVGPVTVTAILPPGITTREIQMGEGPEGASWNCVPPGAGSSVVTCTIEETFPSFGYLPFLDIKVNPPAVGTVGPLLAEFTVSEGGAAPVTKQLVTPVTSGPIPFAVSEFSFEPTDASGSPSLQAAGHPWQLTNAIGTTTTISPPAAGIENDLSAVKNLKDVVVELPLGLLGNPTAVSTCRQEQLREKACPPDSRVGKFAIIGGQFQFGEFEFSGRFCCSAVYNMKPEAGFPAEFSFEFAQQITTLYASVIHGPDGYKLRATATGIPAALEITHALITFFGDPGAVNESGSETAFLTNPSQCGGGDGGSRLRINSWEDPLHPIFAKTSAYAGLGGCAALSFNPMFTLNPSASDEGGTQSADTPSAYTVNLTIPQTTGFDELATPPLKTATVTLPQGLSVSPSAAQGLNACAATGPNGINIGSNQIGPQGQDLGDPEATELGAGHLGGNGSHYDDGLYHLAPGQCPDSSQLGTVVATTPLLESPLPGHIYLAAPECAPCGDADAQSGKLLRLYLELNDPTTGVIVKLAGSASADPATGQLTATFKENPQFPFEDLKLSFRGGPRAPLANPETCGSFQTNASLEPWSAPETPTANSASQFQITSGPGGSACANTVAQEPNHPQFQAGTVSNQAGTYSPFVLKLGREDGTQRLKALNVTLPPGLTGKLAGVQECSSAAITTAETKGGKAEQASPSCPLASELGTVNVGAGPGGTPLYVQGHAYLAGPYKGAPLSMAIITPAVAGPFDLGTVVVRAALFVDPYTAQITVKSDPIPQIRSGILLDVRSIAVNISRNQFTLNPTSCDPTTLAATVIADASEAAVSSPFQVGGCSSLAFKPKLQISLKGGTKRNQHPALKAVVTYPQGGGYANIARAQVGLPHSEFLDQGNLDKVCKQAELLSASCPKSSIYGHAKAWTPLLEKPLEGPVYLAVGFGYQLPALVADLNGQIRILLKGKVDTTKHQGLRNTFETVPDAPVSRFVLSMKGGKRYGLLVNSENICSKPQKASARFVAANGKVLQLQPKIANSCSKKGKGKKSQHAN